MKSLLPWLTALSVAGFAPAAAAAPPPTRPAPSAARTLEDLRLRGESPVPQVLFITTRDQRRFVDLQHHRWLVTSRALAEKTVLPSHLLWIENPPNDTRKGISP